MTKIKIEIGVPGGKYCKSGDSVCPECGKEFYFQADVEVTYSTQRKES